MIGPITRALAVCNAPPEQLRLDGPIREVAFSGARVRASFPDSLQQPPLLCWDVARRPYFLSFILASFLRSPKPNRKSEEHEGDVALEAW